MTSIQNKARQFMPMCHRNYKINIAKSPEREDQQ